MIAGFSGIIVIFSDNLGAGGSLGIWGMAAIVFSAFFSSMATILAKKHFHDINPLPLTAVQSAIGAVALTVLGLAVESLSDYRMDVKTIGSLLYLGILGTAATFSLYLYLLKRMEATKLATIAFITPIAALLLGIVIRSERFDAASIVGSFMVLAGVFVAVVGDNLIRARRGAEIDPSERSAA